MTLHLYLTYLAASIALIMVPGPTVTLVIANSLRHGLRAGLLNIAGTQLGLAVMLAVLLLGLETVMAVMGRWFDWIRLAGAAYLLWLGGRMLWQGSQRPAGEDAKTAPAAAPSGGFLLQGLLVILANPKALLFFGAFIPQFIDPTRPTAPQVLLLGLTFMVVGTLGDGLYAVLAGQARGWLTGERRRRLEQAGGLVLVGGSLWLALQRR